MKKQNEKCKKTRLHGYEKHKKAKKRRHRVKKALLCGVTSLALAVTVAVTLLVGAAAVYVERHPNVFCVDLTLFSRPSDGGASRLYYYPNGADDPVPSTENALPLESGQLSEGVRVRYVPLSEIPTSLQNAFVAIEDKRFYRHNGVDLCRTGAAALNYLLRGKKSFGGSTITQQLVKNVTGENAKTPMRKISEIFRAIDLEKHLCKSEILEAYLNVVPLANGCLGVGAAAELYFGKPPAELSLSECASVAAITQNPSRYDPIRRPEENRTRRDSILREMHAQGYITEEECRAALEREVVTVGTGQAGTADADQSGDATEGGSSACHSWYTDLVVSDVIRDLCEKKGYTRAEASHLLYYGGLRIYTPIDPTLQSTLEAFYRDASAFPRPKNGRMPASGMIVLDPETGNVLAVVGAIGEKTGDRLFSFATDAKRPPGSTLKPLSVYAPALEYGLAGYASVYDDVPVSFEKNGEHYETWPRNASGIYRGLSSVNEALERSLNTVAVRLLSEVGIDRSFDFLKNTLGITSLADGKISDRGAAALALGQMQYGATLREITAAYTALANGGVYRNARSYLLVTDASGQVILENEAVARRAISAGNAELMTKMLENVVENGTARALTLRDTVAIAGKTGTTQYGFDRWFIGYTPTLLAGVWYGYEYPETIADTDGNPALTVWDNAMRALCASGAEAVRSGETAFSYRHLRAVRVCRDSGMLTSDACTLDPRGDRSTVAYFTEGTVPHTFCTCHVAVPYSGSGKSPEDGVLGEDALTDAPHAHLVGLVRVHRAFPTEVYVSDAQFTAAPVGVPAIIGSDPTRPYYAEFLAEGVYVGKSYASRPFNRPCTRQKQYGAAP